jgi:membrane protein DedA with SNARE-associated domain
VRQSGEQFAEPVTEQLLRGADHTLPVSLPAGHARVPVARFAVLTMLGCAIWASGFVLAGALLGASWQEAGHALRIPILLIGAAAGGAVVLKARRRKS